MVWVRGGGRALAAVLLTGVCLGRAARADAPPPAPPRTEVGLLPALGYQPETGLELGLFLHRARYAPGTYPYRSRVRLQVLTSILAEPRIELPRQLHFFKIDLPQRPDAHSRVRAELFWERQVNAGYYGVGNATVAADPGLVSDRYHEYRVESWRGRVTLERALAVPGLRALVGVGLARVDVDPYADSLLAADHERAAAAGREIPGVPLYTTAEWIVGVVLDRRDHETAPTRGLFHDVGLRLAPSFGEGPGFGAVTYTARFYLPILGEELVLATRVLGDVLFGEAPLLDLNRYGGVLDAVALGGLDGVRGIGGGRFVGKTKVLGNVELRAALFPFRLFGTAMNLGAAAILDAGRVWSQSLAPDPDRDGDGLGLHWGAGAGLRLRWGDSLLIRLEAVRSPHTDDFGGGPMAVYLGADSRF